MDELAKEYKNISLQILKNLESKNLEEIDNLFDKRQIIIDNVENFNEFKKNLLDENIVDLDENIKKLLNENIELIKQEIKEHNLSKKANITYGITGNKKLNIFNKKV